MQYVKPSNNQPQTIILKLAQFPQTKMSFSMFHIEKQSDRLNGLTISCVERQMWRFHGRTEIYMLFNYIWYGTVSDFGHYSIRGLTTIKHWAAFSGSDWDSGVLLLSDHSAMTHPSVSPPAVLPRERGGTLWAQTLQFVFHWLVVALMNQTCETPNRWGEKRRTSPHLAQFMWAWEREFLDDEFS